jgi:hypothetical protein
MRKVLIPAGYMAKNIVTKPNWLKANDVNQIYSVSSCISEDFTDYIDYWKHNNFWFFNSIDLIQEIINFEGKILSDYETLYYELYEKEFDESVMNWKEFKKEEDFGYNVELPINNIFLGFDLVSYSCGTIHECSPLSCNSLAESVPTNKYCLFDTIDDAIKTAEDMNILKGEPGPYRIIKVSKIATK